MQLTEGTCPSETIDNTVAGGAGAGGAGGGAGGTFGIGGSLLKHIGLGLYHRHQYWVQLQHER